MQEWSYTTIVKPKIDKIIHTSPYRVTTKSNVRHDCVLQLVKYKNKRETSVRNHSMYKSRKRVKKK